jgi:plastocyanin
VSIAIISSDKVVFALAFGIPVVVFALMGLWSRPRKWQALWALISLAAIAGTAIVAGAAFRGETPGSTPVAIATTEPSPVAPSPSVTVPPTTPSPVASTPAAQCTPKGTKLHLTAHLIKFNTDCLAAPADTAFTVIFDNQDGGVPHNIHILSADPSTDPNAQSFFDGDLVLGPSTATLHVSAIPAGTYFFRCDVHPTAMFGTFVSG